MALGVNDTLSAALPTGERLSAITQRLGGSRGWSGRVRNMFPLPVFEPRTVQPLARRYLSCHLRLIQKNEWSFAYSPLYAYTVMAWSGTTSPLRVR